jgi:hypothetical protein
MNRTSLLTIAAVVLTAVCALAAKEKKIVAADLRITGQLAGWKERPGEYKRFDAKKLFELIDGGAPAYNEHGLVEGIHQMLVGNDKKELEVFAEDFGSPDSAASMLAHKKTSLGHTGPFAGIDSTRAFVYDVLGGYCVYMVIGRFYFELLLTGVTDRSVALGEVTRFVDRYQTLLHQPSVTQQPAR